MNKEFGCALIGCGVISRTHASQITGIKGARLVAVCDVIAEKAKKLAEEYLIQWIVEEQTEIIATGAIVIYDFPPSYTNKSGKKAYVTNMYTKNDYRGKGIATGLLTKLVDEAKSLGITKMWLGASKLGRPVYKKFGFKETDEWMELEL